MPAADPWGELSLAEEILMLENLDELDFLGGWLSNSLVSGVVMSYGK